MAALGIRRRLRARSSGSSAYYARCPRAPPSVCRRAGPVAGEIPSAREPPSTAAMSVPVTKSAARTGSHAVPKRSAGMRGLLVRGRHAFASQLGQKETGQGRVHPARQPRPFGTRCAGKTEDAVPADDADGCVGSAAMRGARGDVDDGAASACTHRPQSVRRKALRRSAINTMGSSAEPILPAERLPVVFRPLAKMSGKPSKAANTIPATTRWPIETCPMGPLADHSDAGRDDRHRHRREGRDRADEPARQAPQAVPPIPPAPSQHRPTLRGGAVPARTPRGPGRETRRGRRTRLPCVRTRPDGAPPCGSSVPGRS